MNEAWPLLERAIALDPDFAAAHAARANVLVRAGQVDDARRAYVRALACAPSNASVHFALAELTFLGGDTASADASFAAAFARARQFAPPRPHAANVALMLGAGGPWPRNIPLDFIVDDARWALHRWFLPDTDDASLPACDVIVNAIGESDAAADAIADAARIIARAGKPAINAPARLRGLARDRLGATLAGIPDCVVPAGARVERDTLVLGLPDAVTFPALVRPVDTHGGRGLERIDSLAMLDDYLARIVAPRYDVSAFIDYRGADGTYRKYRIVYVEGTAYPYHLAIDRTWMIHYYRAPMAAEPAWRDDEDRFLDAPAAVLASWNGPVRAVGAALGLDYVGIDCAQLPDGRLLVFEADTAMLVHGLDPDGTGAYKRPAFERIRTAFHALLAGRAADAQPLPGGARLS